MPDAQANQMIMEFVWDQAEAVRSPGYLHPESLFDFNLPNGFRELWEAAGSPRLLPNPLVTDLEVEGQPPASGTLQLSERSMAAARLRPYGPSPSEWNKQRAEIEHLYIEKEMKLEDVRLAMMAKGFHASENMYKKRFKAWQSRKYLNKEEKANAIAQQENAVIDPLVSAPPTLHGKPLNTRRLYRPVQHQGKRFKLGVRPEDVVRRIMRHHYQIASRRTKIDRHILQQCPQSLKIEHILRCAHGYHKSGHLRAEVESGHDDSLGLFDVDLSCAESAFRHSTELSFRHLNKCCSEIGPVLANRPFLLFELLIRRLPLMYSAFKEALMVLVRYASSKASQLLGCEHPLTYCVTTLALLDEEQVDDLSTAFTHLKRDLIRPMVVEDNEIILRRTAAQSFWVTAGCYDIMSEIYDRLSSFEVSESRVPTTEQRFALSQACIIQLQRGNFERAEEMCQKLLEWSVHLYGTPNADGNGIYACLLLGSTCYFQSRYHESENYARLAVDGMQRQNWSASSVLFGLQVVEYVYYAQGKYAEIEELRQEYRPFYTQMDKWALRSDPLMAI